MKRRRHKRFAKRQPGDALRSPAGGPAARNARRELVALDTRAIRRKALHAYRAAERALAGLKEALKRYHERDVSGFRAWIHQAFGQLLAEQRDLLRAVEEKRDMLSEIAYLSERDGITDGEAYQRVLWRRANPEAAEAEDRRFEEEMRRRSGEAEEPLGGGGEPWETDDDDDPLDEDDRIPDDEWEAFSDFFEDMTGERPPPRAFRRAPPKAGADEKSAKELYRSIVRQLHPDHHGHMTEARKNLWHEAQDAYRRRDLNALYSVLARCDTGQAGIGEHSPVSLIRRLTLQLKTATQAAKREIRDGKKDPAWDYAARIQNPHFVAQVRFDIEQAVGELRYQLHSIENLMRDLERQSRSPSRPRRGRRPPRFDLQQDLPF